MRSRWAEVSLRAHGPVTWLPVALSRQRNLCATRYPRALAVSRPAFLVGVGSILARALVLSRAFDARDQGADALLHPSPHHVEPSRNLAAIWRTAARAQPMPLDWERLRPDLIDRGRGSSGLRGADSAPRQASFRGPVASMCSPAAEVCGRRRDATPLAKPLPRAVWRPASGRTKTRRLRATVRRSHRGS